MTADGELLPPITSCAWWGVAVHEAGHAVAYTHAALAIHGNPYGCRSIHIRPGMSPHWLDERGRRLEGAGACQTTNLFDIGMSQHGRVPPRAFWPSLRRVADWEIVGCLAGPFAELERQGAFGPVTDREAIVEEAGGDGDLEKVDLVLEDLKALGRRDPGIKRHMRLAWRLVESNSEAIEALAERLQTQPHLEHQEVWETIRPHMAAT